MSISELSVRRPILMTMIYLLIALIALVYIPQLDIALYPSVEMPVISVMVSAGNYGPEEIENQVAKTLEDSLFSLENLDSMRSISATGSLMIILEFDYGTDLDEAYDNVQNVINMTSRSLPSWADTPTVMRMDTSNSSEVISLYLTGDYSLEYLKSVAEDTLSPLLERIEGVAEVSVRGGYQTKYEIRPSLERLYAYNLTLTDISSAINEINSETYIGTTQQGDLNYELTTDSRYKSVSEIENTIIKTDGNAIIRLSDVASVVKSEESSTRSYIDGNEVIDITVQNDSDSNASNVASTILSSLDSIREELPNGVNLEVNRDSTEMIRSTMNEVYTSAFEGIILAALVIFLFLRNIKATIIISLSMPISILITLMCMAFFNLTINSMTMAGLILGIGMIVDASIIILENTYSYREKGYKSAVAAILGSKSMWSAIFASTLTTICVFLPLIIYKYDLGMIGIMFEDLIITICISLASSLFVSITLVPALSGSILPLKTRVQKPLKNRVLRGFDSLLSNAEEHIRMLYIKALSYVLSHKALFISILILLLLFFVLLFSSMDFSLAPQVNTDDSISLSLTMKEGTVKEVTLEKLFSMEKSIEEALPEGSFKSISLRLDRSSNTGTITISLPDITKQEYSASEVKELIRPLLANDPSATWSFSEGRGFSSSAVDISIASENSTLLDNTVSEIVALLTNSSALVDIESDSSNGSPEITLEVDEDKAKLLGLNISTLQSTLNSTISGVEVTEITTFDDSTTYTLYLTLEHSITSIQDLENLLIEGSNGLIRLDQVATFTYGLSPKSIIREDRVTINHVTANAATGYTSSEANEIAKSLIEDNIILSEDVTISYGGEMADFNSYIGTMIIVVILALLLVYMVMAAQFESLIDPLIIFATIPLLLIGVIAIHLIMHQSFSLFSLVGVIALIGVVVNNGIVLVDAINRLVNTKIKVYDACLLAAKNRLRPILMTTLTTLLGMVPMAFFPGEGSEMLQPIAVTFFGGIITGSFLTLFLSPSLYLIFNKRREKRYDDATSLKNQLLEYDKWRSLHIDSEEMPPEQI